MNDIDLIQDQLDKLCDISRGTWSIVYNLKNNESFRLELDIIIKVKLKDIQAQLDKVKELVGD